MNGILRRVVFGGMAAVAVCCWATLGLAAGPGEAKVPVKAAPTAAEVERIRDEANVRFTEGETLYDVQDWGRAFQAFSEARAAYESIGEFDDDRDSMWAMRVGMLECGRGNFDTARGHFRHAQECRLRHDGRPHADPLFGLGYIEFILGRDVQAANYFEEAVALRRLYDERQELVLSLQWLAAVRTRQGNSLDAVALLREGAELSCASRTASAVDRAECLRRLSRAEYAARNYPQALAAAEETVTWFEKGLGKEHFATQEERLRIARIVRRLDDQERRRHLPQEFARLQARFVELSEADRGKKRFYAERQVLAAFEPRRWKDAEDGKAATFPDCGGAPLEVDEFRRKLGMAALDVAKVQELSDASLRNLREVLAGLEIIDGNNRAALDHLRAARAIPSPSHVEEIRTLNLSLMLESDFGNDATLLDCADEVYAYSRRIDATFALHVRAGAASQCREPALRERCRRYLDLVRESVLLTYGERHWQTAQVCKHFALFYMRTQDPRGIAEAERMTEILRDQLPADAPQWKYVEFTLADACMKCGRPARAEALLETLLTKFRRDAEPDQVYVALILRRLARLDAHHGRKDSARRRYDEAAANLAGNRHYTYEHRLVLRERDEMLNGKPTLLGAFDPPEPMEDTAQRATIDR